MKMKRLAALWLCILLAAGLFPVSAEGSGTGTLRVLLRRLGLKDTCRITLEGEYLLEGGNGTEMLLHRGTELTLRLREDRILLFHETFSMPAGSSLTLRRQEDGGETSGLYIGSAGLYPGDLKLTVDEGKLRPVLTLAVEDYLLGVVPYEMSESFPLEALKAQAVCARTYALNKADPKKDWDVVDTTNDQVFRGVSASNTNTAKAVSETAGFVLARKGKLVECYYSASNGGQTEIPAHVWEGTKTAGKYEITDDRWDAANPDSLVRSAELRKDGTGLYRRITALLRSAVISQKEWKKAGLSDAEGAFRIDRIRAMSVKSPKYKTPSRLMTELEVTLDVSGQKENAESAGEFEPAGTFTVTLQIFPDVLNALGLTINGTENEIVTVTEEEDTFRISSARFGHGVGLSQRGAQFMASNDGTGFEDILAFYFPESELKKYEGEVSALPTVPAVLAETPTPVPEATPKPTLMPVTEQDLPEGAYVVSVEKIADGTTLNMRSEPSPVASVKMTLAKHQRLIVLDDMDVPGWAYVRTDAAEGYVMTSYLERAD